MSPSIYLPGMVIPMLPKTLSNGICSLNPNVDRLTFSVFMDIDKSGNVINSEIKKSVICSKERMTYENVTKFIEKTDAEVLKRYYYMKDTVDDMARLARILNKKRKKRGSINFDFPESKIKLGEDGRVISVEKYEIGVSNNIIEEFMLICNETIAEYVYWQNLPFVYRVHEKPDSGKMNDFSKLVKNLGYKLKVTNDIHPKSLQNLLDEIKGTKEERVLQTIMLRSLMKAVYSDNNLGHFGLAAQYYCHFTSPIRRYPDLMIHRILTDIIENKMTDEKAGHYRDIVYEAAKTSTDCEIKAVEVEREVTALKKAEYMSDKIGQSFDGVISSVTGFGFFVELENTVEGLVRVENLEDDYYIFDDKSYSLTGSHTKKTYRIGDAVRVMVAGVNISAKQVDFALDV